MVFLICVPQHVDFSILNLECVFLLERNTSLESTIERTYLSFSLEGALKGADTKTENMLSTCMCKSTGNGVFLKEELEVVLLIKKETVEQ